MKYIYKNKIHLKNYYYFIIYLLDNYVNLQFKIVITK